ncbi:hypothetical protein TeGR_g6174 [Tetraparma gracilis]|uniref:Uncharacterized protein n=1 Tax=Tetraparma gracilis TaxID=2962635 RepID=A0ABQ6M7V7_9STRA|nr:hypothetical protein TeGR_g6174 [Tetraparma gracilis]
MPRHLLQSKVKTLSDNFQFLKSQISSVSSRNADLLAQLDKHREIQDLFGASMMLDLDEIVNADAVAPSSPLHTSLQNLSAIPTLTHEDIHKVTKSVYDHCASMMAEVSAENSSLRSANESLNSENARLREEIFALTKAARLTSLTPTKAVMRGLIGPDPTTMGLEVCSEMLASARLSLATDLSVLSGAGRSDSPVKTQSIQELADASLEESVGTEEGVSVEPLARTIEKEVQNAVMPRSVERPEEDDESVESEMIEVTEKFLSKMPGSAKKKGKEKGKGKGRGKGKGMGGEGGSPTARRRGTVTAVQVPEKNNFNTLNVTF